MSKISWLVATATLAIFGLQGCQTAPENKDGGSGTPSATKTGGDAGGKKFKIGVSIPAADHGWTAGVKYWAEETKKKNPDIEWVIKDAKEPGEQINDLQNMKTQGVDALVILATESAPLTPIAEELHNAGVLIVNVDRGFTKPVADIFIAGDNKAFGQKSAEYMVQKLNGKGKIVIMEGIPCTVNTDRVEAAKAVFAKSPGIQIVAQDAGKWSRETAEKVMTNILTSQKEIDAIWASDDDMALGIETALKAAGRDKNIWILGGAGMKDIVKRVMDKDPLYPADVTYPPSMIANGMDEAVKILKGGKEAMLKSEKAQQILPVDVITPDNAKNFYFPDSIY